MHKLIPKYIFLNLIKKKLLLSKSNRGTEPITEIQWKDTKSLYHDTKSMFWLIFEIKKIKIKLCLVVTYKIK